MRILRVNLLLGTLLATSLAGCSSTWVPSFVHPYRFDIQQGNYVSQEDVDRIKIGMNKDQVRYILGTPLVEDVFHADRWDYIYRLTRADGKVFESRYTVIFNNKGLVEKKGGENLPDTDDPIAHARQMQQTAPAAAKKESETSTKPADNSGTDDQITGTETAPVLK